MGGVCEGEDAYDASLEKALAIGKYKDDPKYKEVKLSDECLMNIKQMSSDKQLPSQDFAERVTCQPNIHEKVAIILADLQKEPLKDGQTKGMVLPPYELVKYPGYFYLGEWKAKKPHGKGKIVSTDSYTEGYFNKGELTCQDGIKIWSNGCYYRGAFNNFNFEGFGIYKNTVDKVFYQGEWKDNKPHGLGKEIIENEKLSYVGKFSQGKRHGEGELIWDNGEKNHYKGLFINGRMNGVGTLITDNITFKGKFQNDAKISGELITQNYVYCGRFINELPQDVNGYYRNRNEGIIYKGGFKGGKKHGKAVVTLPNLQTVKTSWANDEMVSME